MRIYAHRGASAERPENTLAAFARALELGADGVELDVHLAADGVPVVIHDADVGRTTNGNGEVNSLTVTELRGFDAGKGERIPTLAEVVDLLEDKLYLDIEIKDARAGRATLAAVQHLRGDSWAISSFNWDVLRGVRAEHQGAELWPLTTTVTPELLAVAAEIGAPAVAVWDGAVTPESAATLREASLAMMVWTINDCERAITLRRLGTWGVCTDDPARLVAALK